MMTDPHQAQDDRDAELDHKARLIAENKSLRAQCDQLAEQLDRITKSRDEAVHHLRTVRFGSDEMCQEDRDENNAALAYLAKIQSETAATDENEAARGAPLTNQDGESGEKIQTDEES